MYNGVFKLTNIRNLNQIGGITEELHKDKHSINYRMFICSKKRGICSPDFSFAELNKSTPAIPKSKQIRVYSSMKNKMQGTQ